GRRTEDGPEGIEIGLGESLDAFFVHSFSSFLRPRSARQTTGLDSSGSGRRIDRLHMPRKGSRVSAILSAKSELYRDPACPNVRFIIGDLACRDLCEIADCV